jgi:NAD(P)-dependent dehydrogenase (short-subunit alcohol dehydrogenase family)
MLTSPLCCWVRLRSSSCRLVSTRTSTVSLPVSPDPSSIYALPFLAKLAHMIMLVFPLSRLIAGIDRHMSVNAIGHYYAINLLYPLIRKTSKLPGASAPKIIFESSEMHVGPARVD